MELNWISAKRRPIDLSIIYNISTSSRPLRLTTFTFLFIFEFKKKCSPLKNQVHVVRTYVHVSMTAGYEMGAVRRESEII